MSSRGIDRIVYLKNVPSGTSLKKVASWFPRKSVDYICSAYQPGCCFVGFRHINDAHDAVNTDFGNGVRISFAYRLCGHDRESSVFVDSIPYQWTIQNVYDEFEQFGRIVSISMRYYRDDDYAHATVEFSDSKYPELAVYRMKNDKYLKVDFVRGSNKQHFIRDNDGYVQVWTDGCCRDNGRRSATAGIGVYFAKSHRLNVGKRVRGPQTNNVAEFEAVTEAVQRAKDAGIVKLQVNTDSEFVVNCMTKWYRGWRRNGWETSRGPVVNRRQIEELLFEMQDMKIDWHWVPAHSGVEENEEADKLANDAARA